MGHLRDTLMAVCSTPSSPLGPGVPGMVPLLKFRFTDIDRGKEDVGEGRQAGASHCWLSTSEGRPRADCCSLHAAPAPEEAALSVMGPAA